MSNKASLSTSSTTPYAPGHSISPALEQSKEDTWALVEEGNIIEKKEEHPVLWVTRPQLDVHFGRVKEGECALV